MVENVEVVPPGVSLAGNFAMVSVDLVRSMKNPSDVSIEVMSVNKKNLIRRVTTEVLDEDISKYNPLGGNILHFIIPK